MTSGEETKYHHVGLRNCSSLPVLAYRTESSQLRRSVKREVNKLAISSFISICERLGAMLPHGEDQSRDSVAIFPQVIVTCACNNEGLQEIYADLLQVLRYKYSPPKEQRSAWIHGAHTFNEILADVVNTELCRVPSDSDDIQQLPDTLLLYDDEPEAVRRRMRARFAALMTFIAQLVVRKLLTVTEVAKSFDLAADDSEEYSSTMRRSEPYYSEALVKALFIMGPALDATQVGSDWLSSALNRLERLQSTQVHAIREARARLWQRAFANPKLLGPLKGVEQSNEAPESRHRAYMGQGLEYPTYICQEEIKFRRAHCSEEEVLPEYALSDPQVKFADPLERAWIYDPTNPPSAGGKEELEWRRLTRQTPIPLSDR